MDKTLYDTITQKKHHAYRKEVSYPSAEAYAKQALSAEERMAARFEMLCELETPVILPNEQICFMRTVKHPPDVYTIFTKEEWAVLKEKHFLHELGFISNLSPDYERVIQQGLLALRETAPPCGRRVIDSIIGLADRYREETLRQGRRDLANILIKVPRYGATSFHEALQFFRILHYALWLEGNYHNTVGRFDQYMYPYFAQDLQNGLLHEASALALLEDFFLSFNKDNDLYPGVQQGDNGQSLMLGGLDKDGNDCFNLLSELCLRASKNLKLIDPKINLRVHKNTPGRVYTLGSELTKVGLGFPQYSNDDVVIPGLEALGYTHEDAADYTVAACWEFIIPKVGADIANIGAMSYPKAVDDCLHGALLQAEQAGSFEMFVCAVEAAINKQCDEICSKLHDIWFVPSPFMNLLMGCEISKGAKYNNFGIHGTGLSTAADSLAAIEKYVFKEKSVTAEQLLAAVDSDFAQHPELLTLLRYEAPKFANDDDTVDAIAVRLMHAFAKALQGRTNCKGGRYRAGTGSAMLYLWHADALGASPDGRRKGEPFGANLAVSLFAKTKGPVSILKSMAKLPFHEAMNGGPLTLEFHDSVFSAPDSTEKVGMLVKSFMQMGGHQLQLNAVNREVLRDAQKHPENYPQLVVRIWGWSAYFTELDPAYQEHVIARQEYSL